MLSGKGCGDAQTTRRLAQKQPSFKECVTQLTSRVTLRRKCTGAKHTTEAADYHIRDSGRGALHARRSRTVRSGGEHGRENAGVSSEM